jgi:hypothetical protein
MTRTRVYFTVDVECAEERFRRGVLSPPIDWDLRVWGRFAGASRELGIGLIMDELEAAGLAGTFFVEVLGAHYFGRDGLAEICLGIRARGHDVQLHMHPVLLRAEWKTRGEKPEKDDIGSLAPDRQRALLAEGIGLLEAAGVPRAEIVGFRAGNYGADNRTWEAMAEAGLRISSSYNLCCLGAPCRIDWPRQEVELFDTGAGVLELPISSFREPGGGFRHLQITAVSWEETRHYLREARRLDLRTVTIVSHSFELFHLDSIEDRRGRLNRVNLHRLRRLCRFLARHPEEFEVSTVGALARETAQSRIHPTQRSAAPAIPRGSRVRQLRRYVEQALKRVDARPPTLFRR